MIIGRLTSSSPLALTTKSDRPCLLYNFTLTATPSGLSFESMPDSAYATPARYLLEMARRLRERHPAGQISLFNPLYDLDLIHFLRVVALIDTSCPQTGNFVIADADGHPIGYVFDSPFTEFTLSLISTVDATLDSSLLSKLLGEPVQLLTVKWRLGTATRYNRFYSVANFEIYCWLAKHALTLLDSNGSLPPITAIMPYHAGDAIFFALAATRTDSAIKKIAIYEGYAEIVEHHAPELSIVPINLPPPFRNGWEISEEDYFLHHLKAVLPEENLYAFLRPSGDYNRTYFHLIDHFAFALGASPRHPDDLVWTHSHLQRKPIHSPARVLLHFDAGWPMKIYPKDKQERLIDLLLEQGYLVTVLAKTDAQYINYRSVAFHNYPELLRLLGEQDFIIGMDSFPAHLAAHSLGLPTICLFSSTRPDNSNAPSSPYYAYMEKGLPCRPCYAMTRCPVYGGDQCRNFVSPEEIVQKIRSMLAYLTASPLEFAPAANPAYPKPDRNYFRLKHIRTIRLERINSAIFFAHLNPFNHLGYLHQVGNEFFMAWKYQGIFKALFKAGRFILRQALQVLRK